MLRNSDLNGNRKQPDRLNKYNSNTDTALNMGNDQTGFKIRKRPDKLKNGKTTRQADKIESYWPTQP